MDAPSPEIKLHCPECSYDLTGLTEPRCPECGIAFDRADLLARQSSVPQPFNPWDRVGSISSYFETLRLSLFSPRRLFRDYPNRHKHELAISYSMICYTLAALAAFIYAVSTDVRLVFSGLGIGLAVSVAATACEMVIAVVLGWTTRPRAGENSYHYWRGITHYMSGYLILSALLIVTFFILVSNLSGHDADTVAILMSFLAAPLLFAWWALALTRVVFQQSRAGWGRVLGCVMIWPIGAGAIALGFFLSALLAMTCMAPHY